MNFQSNSGSSRRPPAASDCLGENGSRSQPLWRGMEKTDIIMILNSKLSSFLPFLLFFFPGSNSCFPSQLVFERHCKNECITTTMNRLAVRARFHQDGPDLWLFVPGARSTGRGPCRQRSLWGAGGGGPPSPGWARGPGLLPRRDPSPRAPVSFPSSAGSLLTR